MLETYRGQPLSVIEEQFRWRIPDRFNIGVAASERHSPRAVAMVHEHLDGTVDVVPHGHLTEQSDRLANALRSLGVLRGDRVAVILPQHPAVAISHIAICKLGDIAVLLTTPFGPHALPSASKTVGPGW